MKKELAGILQTRMDKCTTEQFWMVMAMTGVNGLVIASPAEIAKTGIHAVVLAIVLGLAAAGAFLYLLSRHKMFFALRAEQLAIFDSDEELHAYYKNRARPEFMKPEGQRVWWFGMTGIVMYSAWVLAGTLGAICSLF